MRRSVPTRLRPVAGSDPRADQGARSTIARRHAATSARVWTQSARCALPGRRLGAGSAELVEHAVVVAPAAADAHASARASPSRPAGARCSGRASAPIARIMVPPLPTRMPFCDSVSQSTEQVIVRRVPARRRRELVDERRRRRAAPPRACGSAPPRARARRSAAAPDRRRWRRPDTAPAPLGERRSSSSPDARRCRRGAAEIGTSAAKSPSSAIRSIARADARPGRAGRSCSRRSRPASRTRTRASAMNRSPAPGRLGAVEHEQDRVDVGERLVDGPLHAPRQAVARASGSPAGRAARAASRRRSATPATRRRVVCGLSETIDTWAPQSAFTSVDLPTFGRPATPTRPQRNALAHRREALRQDLVEGDRRRARRRAGT